MIEVGRTYKHKYGRDVAIKVHSIKHISDGLLVDITWLNVVDSNNIYAIDGEEVIIKQKDVADWLPF